MLTAGERAALRGAVQAPELQPAGPRNGIVGAGVCWIELPGPGPGEVREGAAALAQ